MISHNLPPRLHVLQICDFCKAIFLSKAEFPCKMAPSLAPDFWRANLHGRKMTERDESVGQPIETDGGAHAGCLRGCLILGAWYLVRMGPPWSRTVGLCCIGCIIAMSLEIHHQNKVSDHANTIILDSDAASVLCITVSHSQLLCCVLQYYIRI